MRLTLGFSPCPNDTFIFEALIHHKIDTEGLEFNVSLADVEQLNKWSFEGKLDVTKLSFNAFSKCVSEYALLDSGSALGKKCGPLLIKHPNTDLNSNSKIAIPGKYTTANLLLSHFNPEFSNKRELIFSDIEDQILLGHVDAGLIIHENRFTYEQKGLEKVKDLGESWEKETGLPIPLGGIVVKRTIPSQIQQKLQRVLRSSVEYAFKNRKSSSDFIRSHAQSMEKHVIDSHINLYVNDYSISLGTEGRKAVKLLLDSSCAKCTDFFVT